MLEKKTRSISLGVDLLRDSEAKKNSNVLCTIAFLKTLMRKICSKRVEFDAPKESRFVSLLKAFRWGAVNAGNHE